MKIIISADDKTPIYEQIVNQIKAEILSGELKEGDAMPSMRFLAQDLKISLITTKRAYEELERGGFIRSFVGRGTFVASVSVDEVRKEKMLEVETLLLQAVKTAISCGLTLEQLCEIITNIYGGQDNE